MYIVNRDGDCDYAKCQRFIFSLFMRMAFYLAREAMAFIDAISPSNILGVLQFIILGNIDRCNPVR